MLLLCATSPEERERERERERVGGRRAEKKRSGNTTYTREQQTNDDEEEEEERRETTTNRHARKPATHETCFAQGLTTHTPTPGTAHAQISFKTYPRATAKRGS
jgi:hypothetical protein